MLLLVPLLIALVGGACVRARTGWPAAVAAVATCLTAIWLGWWLAGYPLWPRSAWHRLPWLAAAAGVCGLLARGPWQVRLLAVAILAAAAANAATPTWKKLETRRMTYVVLGAASLTLLTWWAWRQADASEIGDAGRDESGGSVSRPISGAAWQCLASWTVAGVALVLQIAVHSSVSIALAGAIGVAAMLGYGLGSQPWRSLPAASAPAPLIPMAVIWLSVAAYTGWLYAERPLWLAIPWTVPLAWSLSNRLVKSPARRLVANGICLAALLGICAIF